MTTVPVHELKQNLSAWLARAESGEPVIVTRHGKPLVRIVAADATAVVVGARFGKTRLGQVITARLGADALRVLDEDRGDRSDSGLDR